MIVRLRLGRGARVRQAGGKNRRAALVIAALLTPFAVMAAVLGFWRLGSDLNWTGEFAFSNGPLSHWQVWLSVAAGLEFCSLLLGRYGHEGGDSPAE